MSDRNPTLFGAEKTVAPKEDPQRTREREEYRQRLAEKLKDPEFRKIEGFPEGSDEAILALSDPPYYTACPNPFIEEWLEENARTLVPRDSYHREPFAADIRQGKNNPIYIAHSYHTKVPHKAIMHYILHYTNPGDVVYDGFCGTGMTGVAAELCGNRGEVESLGYKVLQDGAIQDEDGREVGRVGVRKAVLSDLSPAATFIAYNYNVPFDTKPLEQEAERVFNKVKAECQWMYTTLHNATPSETKRLAKSVADCQSPEEIRELLSRLRSGKGNLESGSRLRLGEIDFTVWSDVFVCPQCGDEFIFWDVAIQKKTGKVKKKFKCPNCNAEISKRQGERTIRSKYDQALDQSIKQVEQFPRHVVYSIGNDRFGKEPDEFDFAVLDKIEQWHIPHWYPTDRMPEGQESRRNDPSGLTHVHHFFTKRNLWTFATLFDAARESVFSRQLKQFIVGSYRLISKHGKHNVERRTTSGGFGWVNAGLSGTLYIGSLPAEQSALFFFEKRLSKYFYEGTQKASVIISTESTTADHGLSNVYDYIFTDPPFGGNLMYSELNFMWESWLGVKTNNSPEAITNGVQGKALPDYQLLMRKCFERYYQALKPGRWMTVEFHNSENAVWNAIHEALERVGFVIADVRVLDKQEGSFKQVTSSGATKVDLVISCYKPKSEFEKRFDQIKGKTEGVMEFLRQHMRMLPVAPLNQKGQLETIAERTQYLLFDRMVAYHLQHGARIPVSAADFYKLLEEQFVERDGMYFLPDQAAKYDAMKARGIETEQLSIFLQDEKSSVQWLRQQLSEKPQTLGELTPAFMQELRDWPKHEPRPELKDLLREYFVQEGGVWRVPNPDDERDLEELRRNALLKQFQNYVRGAGKLKTFRKEAVLEGFKHCWQTKQYGVIVAVCERIPDKILEEDHDLIQFYDIAKDLAPEPTGNQLQFVWE